MEALFVGKLNHWKQPICFWQRLISPFSSFESLPPPAASLQPHFPHSARQERGDPARPGGCRHQSSRIQNLESQMQARRISVGEAAAPSLPSRNSPNTRASPSQLSRHQSQVEISERRVNNGCTSCKFSLLPGMGGSCHQFPDLSLS